MINIYTLEQSERWDSIVRSFGEYDVYWLSGYVKAFQINGDGEAQLVYFENESTRAINVIFKRDLSEIKYFRGVLEAGEYYDTTTPYGYGGFLVEGNDTETLKEEYEQYCIEHHIICEFVRFHPMLRNWESLDKLYEVIRLGETVYMNTADEEVIWENMTSKNRNMIRKAQKSGLQVYWGRNQEIIEPFMEIYNATMDKDCADSYYYFDRTFYESILEDLKQNAMWFYATIDGQIAAISIFMFVNGKMHYHLSASRREYQKLAPTNLLLYEAAVWAANHGYTTLHMGGGVGSGHDSLYKFKKAFNRGEDAEFCIGKAIFDQEMYRKLVDTRKDKDQVFNEETEYFPKYRG